MSARESAWADFSHSGASQRLLAQFPPFDSLHIRLHTVYVITGVEVVGGPGEVRTLDLMTASNMPVLHSFHSATCFP